jgi:hypothetical protein
MERNQAARAIPCHEAEGEYRRQKFNQLDHFKLLSFADRSILLQYDKSATIDCLELMHGVQTNAIQLAPLEDFFSACFTTSRRRSNCW